MGSDLSVEVENYWTQGGQVLFHEHFRQSDRFAGMSNREAHRFTLLGLPDSQDAPGCDAWAMVSDPDPAGLNVRTEPGTTGQIVDRLPLGARVHILESKNGWLLLDRGGFAGSSQPERLVIAPGWVHGGLLTNAGSGKLYVYESPESGVGGRQVSSEEVGRVHNCLGTWIEVAVDGQRAWVSAPEI
jgi:SH3-like domain-containing protein